MKTDKSAAQQILKSSSNRKIISTWSKNRARISGERLQRWRKLNWPANYANMDDDRWKRITEETIYYRFTISPFKIRIYDRRLKMIPVLLINNRRSKRTTASPFTFRQLISHRRFRDISLSLPFLRISRAQYTSSVNYARISIPPRGILSRHKFEVSLIWLELNFYSSRFFNA